MSKKIHYRKNNMGASYCGISIWKGEMYYSTNLDHITCKRCLKRTKTQNQ